LPPATDAHLRLPSPEAWVAVRRPGHPVLGALSPSRAGDFTTCPLLYRYRAIDRLPEQPSAPMVRGTLVHSVLEQLFDLPAPQRTMQRAVGLLPDSWEQIAADSPETLRLLAPEGDPKPTDVAAWLATAEPLLATYFTMEDPTALEPAHRELHVEYELPDGPLLRGFVDRVDIAPGAGVRIVDYKTGRAPRPAYEQKAMFQLRFYALVVWRMTGTLPRLLQLTYLGSGEVLRFQPDPEDLEAFEGKLRALWASMVAVMQSEGWTPRPGPLCRWCSFAPVCPAQGGEALPLPAHARAGGTSGQVR